MTSNPVEDNFVTRFILGLAVIFAMMFGGGAGGVALSALDIPFGRLLGTVIGALLVFAAFAVLYRRYDASYAEA